MATTDVFSFTKSIEGKKKTFKPKSSTPSRSKDDYWTNQTVCAFIKFVETGPSMTAFTIAEFALWAITNNLTEEPSEPRRWGSIPRMLSTRKIIVGDGFRKETKEEIARLSSRTSNPGVVAVWRMSPSHFGELARLKSDFACECCDPEL